MGSKTSLTKSLFKGDKYLWYIFGTLCVASILIGYSVLYTAALRHEDYNQPILKHCTFVSIAIVIALSVQRLKGKSLALFLILVFVGGLGLECATLLIGSSVNGATRSIGFVQPSELVKLGYVFFVAWVSTTGVKPDGSFDKKSLIIWSIVSVISIGPIAMENLSTGILMFVVSIAMLFFAGLKIRTIFSIIGSLILIVVLLDVVHHVVPEIKFLHRFDTWEVRVIRFFEGGDIEKFSVTDKNFQETCAKVAVSNSKGFGQGLADGEMRKILPQGYSDYVYSLIVEELGFLGGAFIIILYLCLLFRTIMFAYACDLRFYSILLVGCSLMIVIQAIINISVGVTLIPVTGQPLPMISRGGSSQLITGMFFGVMFSVSQTILELNSAKKKSSVSERKDKAVVDDSPDTNE